MTATKTNAPLDQLLLSGLVCTDRYNDLKAERDEQLRRLGNEISSYRSNFAARKEAGETTGDHIRDMVAVHHGFEHFDTLVEAYRTFEKQLVGHTGEFVLISYQAEVPFRHHSRGVDTQLRDLFRLGVLEGEQLIWARTPGGNSITLPVPRYVSGNGELAVENIFSRRYSMDRGPGLLGAHILRSVEGIEAPQEIRSSYIHEILIGDEAVKEWVKKRPFKLDQAAFEKAGQLLGKFDLEPMGPNDGPLPYAELPDPLGR